jgi:hypothetical protein
MPPRRPARRPVSPADAQAAAGAAAARKAERAPHTLTEADVARLPGKTVLALGNQGKLRHLGVGTKPLNPPTPAATAPARKTGKTSAKRGTARKTSK